MSDQNTMDQFMNEIDSSMKRVQKGDVLEGKIISLNNEELIVNIGYIADGVVRKEELTLGKSEDLSEVYKSRRCN